MARPEDVTNIPAQSFLPTLAVAEDGTVGLLHYDFRNDRLADAALTTDVWFSHSHDEGQTWSEIRLAGPFDMRTAPEATRGRFLGDYAGLVALPGGFGALFAQAKPQATVGASDIFFARITRSREDRERRCLARRSPIGPRNIGRIRLGYSRRRLLRLPVKPTVTRRRSNRYCVKRTKGRLQAVFSRRGRVVLVATTARSHGNRGVRPGAPLSVLGRAYPRHRAVGRGLYRARPRSPHVIGVRDGRVRFVGVADPRLLGNERALKRHLRLAGL